MPGKIKRVKIGGKVRLLYRRPDGKYKIGKHRYSAYSPGKDAARRARGKPKRGYPHAGDRVFGRKTKRYGKFGWW